jgi:hypothetical protein
MRNECASRTLLVPHGGGAAIAAGALPRVDCREPFARVKTSLIHA